MSEYDVVIFDLDGTLVELAVDWAEVWTDVSERLIARDVPLTGVESTWDALAVARKIGMRDDVGRIIADHEIRGAIGSKRLPLADTLESIDVPIGVCSLNCEEACRLALGTHDRLGHIDAVTGRDTYRTWKPDPAPLENTIEALCGETEAAVFIGDSESDRETAQRAGVAFWSVSTALDQFRTLDS